MVLMILEKVPRSLRGELSRWLIEVQPGVFVGKVSALVRDLLWDKCLKKGLRGSCCQVWTTNNEQGFAIRLFGDSTREVVDMDGLYLVRKRHGVRDSQRLLRAGNR
ncbi:MAG: type I-E CRISPR-associated endoribonuclease Cas2 [Dehalococcoidales bacterium]|nr:type I-E CRISPR-associated endoribonuclease Cas2 [Dehalococcoidales bacterium]